MRGWVLLAMAGCGFSGHNPGDDAVVSADGPPRIDARVIDGATDAMIDARIDAAPTCPASPPPGCSGGLQFECTATAESCYALCRTTRTHGAAESDCVAWGGHLASLAVAAERTCVDAIVEDDNPGDIWMGARQNTSGGGTGAGWSWLDSTTFTNFNGWSSGQPDDLDNNENGEEDCGSLESSASYEGNDDDCGQTQAYLCERPKQ